MMIVVTYVAADGSLLRRSVNTAARHDGPVWEGLVQRAALDFPPAYRPAAGRAVYHVRAGEQAVLVAEDDLIGPLRELVAAVLSEGEGR
ncbi:MAG: hypothetical protein ACM32E_00090 [Gemmatimonadota bacterium]